MSTKPVNIYLDNASTTPIDSEVFKEMKPFLVEDFGNPSSITAGGVRAKKAVEGARKSVATLLRALPDEIVFTSGGTESNNLAIFGLVKSLESKGLPISKMHFITTNIEHSSVLEPMRELERRGAQVDFVPVESNGIVDLKKIKKALKGNTVLVSVMYANNEIGTVQPISEIAKILRHSSKSINYKLSTINHKLSHPFFHCDASQAPLYLDMHVEKLGVDLLTLDAHKIYGPKGVGALYVKRGVEILPVILGGGQENNLRSTTENVAGIIGLSKAFEIADKQRIKESLRLTKLRNYFYSQILKNLRIEKVGEVNGVILNGDLEKRLPNNLNISLVGVDTEFLIIQLDNSGVVCSAKSSCLRDEAYSYVVKALGGTEGREISSIRFSLGRGTSKKDIDFTLKILKKLLQS